MKLYREHVASKKSVDLLSQEDRYVYQLSLNERLATKVNVMRYIGSFSDNIDSIQPVSG